MPTAESSRCPVCGTVGTLSIKRMFRAKPLGTWSLSGAQMKLTGWFFPLLVCSGCGLGVPGHYDPDGRHVTFPALAADPPDSTSDSGTTPA